MKWRLAAALLTWLVLPGCADADRDLPATYRKVNVPETQLRSPEAQARGRRLFLANCALCHGVRGDGQGERKAGMDVPPRNFLDPAWRERTTPRHVFFAIREGLAGTPMAGWKTLSERDAWDLTAYILSLRPTP
jgi:mono/diheme cytochrome c family protein